jgi:hypothetical protein
VPERQGFRAEDRRPGEQPLGRHSHGIHEDQQLEQTVGPAELLRPWPGGEKKTDESR